MTRAWARAVTLISIVLACCAYASALDPSLDISQYAHTSWKVRDGFVQGFIGSIAQTPDGYLWLGTEFGLVRFDGVRATPWQPPTGQQLPSAFIYSLLVARDGALWIGTHSGLASWKDGKLTQYPELAGSVIYSLVEDREGIVWATTEVITASPTQARLCAVRSGRVQCYGTLHRGIDGVYQDTKGNLWTSGLDGLWQWRPGPPQHYYTSPIIGHVVEDDNGTILFSAPDGLKQLVKGRVEKYAVPGIHWQFTPQRLFRSGDGSLWIGTGDRGLIHVHRGRVDWFALPDGLSGNDIFSIFEDREGNVWVGTSGGLDRFRDVAVPTIFSSQGLADETVWSVLAARDGSIWLGSESGVSRLKDGELTIYRRPRPNESVALQYQSQPRSTSAVQEISNSRLPAKAESLFEDDVGRIWVTTSGGVARWDGTQFALVDRVSGTEVYAIAEDRRGTVWLASQEHGLIGVSRAEQVEQIPWSRLGRGDFALSMVTNSSQDGLWLGFARGDVAYWEDGQIRSSYGTGNGLGKGAVRHLRFGAGGALWAATAGGLSRIKDGRIATLTSRNGLPCDGVHWSIEDDNQAVWLYMPCGLARIERSDIDAWAADPTRTVHPRVLDLSDGVRARAILGGWGPDVSKSPDGRIWFSSTEGVSYIDPKHLALNRLPPPVHIEQIIADRKTYEPSSGLRLPPYVRDLEIDYTALSLMLPEKVRFRVKLEGQDKDWRELVNIRHVEYTNLPPQHYRFHVLACNNSGVWNEAGDSLEFDILPAWYETFWFRTICVLAFLALIWLIYKARVHQIKQQEARFREAVESMPAMAFVAQPDGQRTFMNKGWLEYTGLSREQASDSRWEAEVHPDDLKRVTEEWRAAQTAGQPLAYEARIRRGCDGIYRWFQMRAQPLRDARGKIVKWCAVATDIEDRKRAEQLQLELARVNRVSSMGELTASLAHEIKQPIGAAVTNAEACARLLDRDQPDVLEAREAALEMAKDAMRAAEIIDRVRVLYRKGSPKLGIVDVNELVSDMIIILRNEAKRHSVAISTDLAAELPRVKADRVQLQQVFMNLMLNGIEAMSDAGGVLTIKSRLRENEQIQISVDDTGPGLPPGKADQIFEAFFTTKPEGSGIGLAISKSIVESHGGRIWANGNGGRGATFHFTLPPGQPGTKDPSSPA